MNKTIRIALMGGSILAASGCATQVILNDGSQIRNVETVLGGVEVKRNAKAGNISSVNGGVNVESGATAMKVDTVNGGISLSNNVTITSAVTVNGSIKAGNSLQVNGALETVNGSIILKSQTNVNGSVVTVNGDIDVDNTVIHQNIKTVNGDIRLVNESVLKGDLIIERKSGWGLGMSHEEITIKIDATSRVEGTIHLHRPALLEIADRSKVNKIEKHYSQK